MAYQSITNTFKGDYASHDLIVDESPIHEFVNALVSSDFESKTTDDLTQGVVNKYYSSSLFDTDIASKTTDDLVQGIMNEYYSSALFDSDFDSKTTDDLTEGTNKYYSSSLFDSDFDSKTTDDLVEGINKYYSTALFDSDFTTKTTSDLAEGSNLYWTQLRFDTAFDTAIASSTVVDDVIAGISGDDIEFNSVTTTKNGQGVRMNGVDHCFMSWYANAVNRSAYMGKPSGGSSLFSLVIEENLSLFLQTGNAATYFQASDASLARWYFNNGGAGDLALNFGNSADNDAGRIRYSVAFDKFFFYTNGANERLAIGDTVTSQVPIVAEDGIISKGAVVIDYIDGNAPQLVLKDDEGSENCVIRMPSASDAIGNDTVLIQNKQGQADMVFTTENGGDFRFCQDYSTDAGLNNYSFFIGHANVGGDVSITDPYIAVGNNSGNIGTATLKLEATGTDYIFVNTGSSFYIYDGTKFWFSAGTQLLLGNATSVTNIYGSEVKIQDGPLDTGNYLPKGQFAILRYNIKKTIKNGAANADLLPALTGASNGSLFTHDLTNEDIEFIGSGTGYARVCVNMHIRSTSLTPDGAGYFVQLRRNGSIIRTISGYVIDSGLADHTVSLSMIEFPSVSSGDKFTIYTYTDYGLDLANHEFQGDLSITPC